MHHHLHHPLRDLERRLDRIGQSTAVGGADHQPVYHHRDVVILAPIEGWHLVQIVGVAIDPDSYETALADFVEQFPELPLTAPHQRGQHLDPSLLRPTQNRIGDLGRAGALDGTAVVGTMRDTDPGPKQTQIVVDLGDGPHGRAGIVAGRLLLDGDRGGEAFDRIDVRLFHESEELPGVGGQGLDVPALSLGVDRVEGEGRLARSREPGDDRQLVPGDPNRDVLEVVFASAGDDEVFLGHKQGNVSPRLARFNPA
jgi:hypothetical protein